MQLLTIDDNLHPYQSNSDQKILLEEAIKILPDRMRACFVLFAIEGFKQHEIADILEITIGGVKSNIFHAKTKLKSILKDKPSEESS